MPARASSRRDLRDHGIDVALAVDARLVEPAGDAAVLGRLEPAEGEVLEFPLELPDAEAIRERRVDLACLPGEVQPCGVVEVARMPHPSQLVREAHEDEARVGDDGQQHAPQRIRLPARQAPARRQRRAGTELAEAPEFLREDGRGLRRRSRPPRRA